MATQPPLESFHLPVILLVIIAKQMQQAVEREDPQFGLERVSSLPGLSPCDTAGNHNVSKKVACYVRCWKRQDIRRRVFLSVLAIEGAYAHIGNDRHAHRAAHPSRSHLLQPPGKPWGAHS